MKRIFSITCLHKYQFFRGKGVKLEILNQKLEINHKLQDMPIEIGIPYEVFVQRDDRIGTSTKVKNVVL